MSYKIRVSVSVYFNERQNVAATSRTKRFVVMLAAVLAIGIIAAAPYVFHALTDARIRYSLGPGQGWGMHISGDHYRDIRHRDLSLNGRYFSVRYFTRAGKNQLGLTGLGWPIWLVVPSEYITLRVACAVPLMSIWLLFYIAALVRKRRRISITN